MREILGRLSFTLEATYCVVQIIVPKAFWQKPSRDQSQILVSGRPHEHCVRMVFVNDAILLGARLTHVVQFFTGQWSPS